MNTAALHNDLRFRGAPLELRGLYRMLLDFEDAAGDVAARGVDGVGAAAAALGCNRDEAAAVVARLAEHGLVRAEPGRVCLLVGSRRGKRGGMAPAERVRRSRAGDAAPKAQDVTAGNGIVTGQVPGIAAVSGNGNGSALGGARETPPIPRVPPPSLPHPPSLPLTPSPPAPAGGVAGGAPAPGQGVGQGRLFAEPPPPPPAPKPQRPRLPNAPPPLPFKVGEALAALAAASDGRFVAGEGRDVTQAVAIAVTAQIRAYPTLAEWRSVGAWLAAGALAHRGALGPSWVASTDFRNAMALSRSWDAHGRPALGRPAPVERAPPQRSRRVGPAPVSTPEDFARAEAGPDPLLALLDRG